MQKHEMANSRLFGVLFCVLGARVFFLKKPQKQAKNTNNKKPLRGFFGGFFSYWTKREFLLSKLGRPKKKNKKNKFFFLKKKKKKKKKKKISQKNFSPKTPLSGNSSPPPPPPPFFGGGGGGGICQSRGCSGRNLPAKKSDVL